MKKLLALIVTGVVVGLPVVQVRAVESGTSIDDTRGDVKEQVKEQRLQLKSAEEKLKSEFHARVNEIKDKQKKQILERLNKSMCNLNLNRTAIMQKHLDEMSKVLDRVVAKATEVKAKGKDVSGVDSAVEVARKLIEETKLAVSGQAGKACGLAITGNVTTLRSEVSSARGQLESEIKALIAKVTESRKATGEAVRSLARLRGEVVPEPVKN